MEDPKLTSIEHPSDDGEYPPLVITDLPPQLVSSLHKSWMEVAVQKPTNPTNRLPAIMKPSPVVPNKPDVEEAFTTNPFCFLIKVPRSADSISLQGQVDRAKLEADEKARLADSIQAQIQEANIGIHELDYENAKGEERKARSEIKLIHIEIDSLMGVISNGNDALCVDDINSKLEKLEDRIQQETLTPKQQKKTLKEMRQLKERRQELLNFLCTEDEIRQAIELRDEAEVRLKMLRKELDILEDSVVRAKASALEAQKKRNAENGNMNGLRAKLRAAIDARKSAYARLQSLKNKLSTENKLFSEYKKDASAAKSCAFTGNKKALHRLCTNQVEKLMQSWNTSGKFRQEYVKSNVGSTVRRLGTLDGRSLGHGEKAPPVIPASQERVDRISMMMTKNSAMEESKQESELTKMLRRENIETEKKEERRLEELAEAEVEARKKQQEEEEEEKEKARQQKRLRKKERMKAIKAEKAAMDTDDTVKICESAAAESSNEGVELPEISQGQQLTRTLPESKQESELTKKAEEEILRRENIEEAEKKEQLPLEELAKAEFEAQRKQEEEKEKARRKRLRKKEKMKAKKAKAAMDEICETAAESSNEEDVVEQVTRTSSLRNRNWRSYRQLMWTGLISFLVYIVFLFGDVDVLSILRGLDWQILNR